MPDRTPRQEPGQPRKPSVMPGCQDDCFRNPGELGPCRVNQHRVSNDAVVPTGREIEEMVQGTAFECAEVSTAGALWSHAIRWLQPEHVDEWEASPGLFAEQLESEEGRELLPRSVVLVHELARPHFDALAPRQRCPGIFLNQTGEIVLKPDKPRENSRDRGCSRRLVQHEAARTRPWPCGRCQDEPEEPRYAFRRVCSPNLPTTISNRGKRRRNSSIRPKCPSTVEPLPTGATSPPAVADPSSFYGLK